MFRIRAALAISGIIFWSLGALPSLAQLGQSEWQTPAGGAASHLGQSEWQTPAGSGSSQFGTSSQSSFGQPDWQPPAGDTLSGGSTNGSQLGQSEWQTPPSNGNSGLGQSQWQTLQPVRLRRNWDNRVGRCRNGAAAKISAPPVMQPTQQFSNSGNSGSSGLGQSEWQQPGGGAQSSGSSGSQRGTIGVAAAFGARRNKQHSDSNQLWCKQWCFHSGTSDGWSSRSRRNESSESEYTCGRGARF